MSPTVLTRRDFLHRSATATATLTAGVAFAETKATPPIGIQLYTLRREMKSDFNGVLRKLAKMGYAGVEFAGYGPWGNKPKELRAFLDEIGLKTCGTHLGFGGIKDNPEGRTEFMRTLGCEFLTVPSMPGNFRKMGRDGYCKFGEEMSLLGEKVNAAGGVLCYHNHTFEFKKDETGKYLYDSLMETADPRYVKIEMDVAWVHRGGVDCIDFIKKYQKRIRLFHMKDLNAKNGLVPCGEGVVPLEEITTLGRRNKSAWYIVEQDSCKLPPLDAVKISLQNLKKFWAI